MSEKANHQIYKNCYDDIHEITQGANGVGEYLDDFTERCKSLTVKLQKDIDFMKGLGE